MKFKHNEQLGVQVARVSVSFRVTREHLVWAAMLLRVDTGWADSGLTRERILSEVRYRLRWQGESFMGGVPQHYRRDSQDESNKLWSEAYPEAIKRASDVVDRVFPELSLDRYRGGYRVEDRQVGK